MELLSLKLYCCQKHLAVVVLVDNSDCFFIRLLMEVERVIEQASFLLFST
jgi:hypothetical protein